MSYSYNKIFSIIFKLAWIAGLLFSLYAFVHIFIFTLFTQSEVFNQSYQLNFWNFILPNLLSIILLFLFTKELLVGYQAKSTKQNWLSFTIFTIIITSILISQFDFYNWLVFDDSDSILLAIPIILILTSFIGLAANRILFKTNKNENG